MFTIYIYTYLILSISLSIYIVVSAKRDVTKMRFSSASCDGRRASDNNRRNLTT
jgi:hypothetical protein